MLTKSLGRLETQQARLAKIYEPHILELTTFVEYLKELKGSAFRIPYFDPLDGGVVARALFILEAPGSRAVASNFVSRDNPDQTAENFSKLLNEAGFRRTETLLWNIVPWYIGSDQKIRPASNPDILEGFNHFKEMMKLLKRLDLVVLVGKKACKIKPNLFEYLPSLRIFESYHPSPQFINRKSENREILLGQLRDARSSLK